MHALPDKPRGLQVAFVVRCRFHVELDLSHQHLHCKQYRAYHRVVLRHLSVHLNALPPLQRRQKLLKEPTSKPALSHAPILFELSWLASDFHRFAPFAVAISLVVLGKICYLLMRISLRVMGICFHTRIMSL